MGTKVLFYGAGENALMTYRRAAQKSVLYGEPAAFIDRDINKHGHTLFSLPILSWEDAKKQYGNNFYIYITGNEKAGPEIIAFLLEQGIDPARIINYEPVEKRYGCWKTESYLFVRPFGDKVGYGTCGRTSESLEIAETRHFGGVYTPSEAVRPENVCHAVKQVHLLSQELADGTKDPYHNGCPNRGTRYYYKNRMIRDLLFTGNGACNFRCTYCVLHDKNYPSRIMYADYFSIFSDVIQCLEEEKLIHSDAVIRLSSGEFTIHRGAEELIKQCDAHPMELFTNAYIYSPATANALEKSAMVFCSMDAGTTGTFKQVKGVDGYERVSENLREYAKHAPVELKYILMDGVKDTREDLAGFFDLADEIAARVVLSRDYTDLDHAFSNRALQFAAQYITHFKKQGKIDVADSFTRSGEKARLNKLLEEI